MIFGSAPTTQAQTTNRQDSLLQIKEYLAMRKSQIEALVPALDALQKEYFQRNGFTTPGDYARKQVQLIDSIIDSINRGESEKTVIYNLREMFSRIELRLFEQDIKSLIESGRTVLPSELAEIPQYLNRQVSDHEAQQAIAKQKEKERLKRVAVAKLEAEKQLRRKRLAEEFGLSEEAIFAKNAD